MKCVLAGVAFAIVTTLAAALAFAQSNPRYIRFAGVRSLNPAITDESRPDLLNPEVDLYNPKNGYNPKGPSNYSDDFKKKYFRAQAERMNRLIDKALAMERAMKDGKYFYPVEGAEHGQTPCVPCEATPGQYSNTVRNFYDYVGAWIDKRF
ncbi:MAG: hypothetical protein EXR70_13590 [Deltaproteobacteria bacterium]|nr:hypothetical protein [Deltaproteobacteria bacterium]